ncbi:hypothetical protein ACLH01_25030, partial [Enterobacter cloacae]|uniref:hypothetical protein n=1 Tax=Enterobacter cloacae TaxID=550 RepID=UPI0039844FF7
CCTRHLGFNQNSFTILVNAVNSKHIFSKIDTDSGDGLGVRLENGNFPTLSVLSLTSDFVPLSANP